MRDARTLGTVLATLVALVAVGLPAGAEDLYDRSYARLSYVKGDVSVQRGSDLGQETGDVNLPVVEGDTLVASSGQAEVQFGRRNFFRLDSASEALFASLPKRGDDTVKIHLLSGQAYLRVTTLEGEKAIEVHTPDASFYIFEEGLYRFEVAEGGGTEILVHEGSAEAAGEEGSVVVDAHERLRARDGGFGSGPETFHASRDGFDGWNATRDDLLGRRASSSYLPSEIADYDNDLEDNGRWVREASYGYVWVPYVQDVEWRPYLFGRWVWYPIIGWTWVSSEPWGWCTYHYGRWHWRFGLGWYWIPTTHWGPAWVHWWHGHDHWGWSPLSYYGRPGVIIGNRYYDRSYGDNYPYNSRALTVIHRDRLQAHGISRHALRTSEVAGLGRISLTSSQPEVKPLISSSGIGSRTLSGSTPRSTVTERGSLSKGGLKKAAPSSIARTPSGTRTWASKSGSVTSGGLSRSNAGTLGTLRTYPSKGSRESGASSGTVRSLSGVRIRADAVKERPSVSGTKSVSGGIKSYAPRSTVRSSTGTTRALPATGVKRSSPTSWRGTGTVRSYQPSSSIKSFTSRSYPSLGTVRRSSGSSSSGSTALRSYGSRSLSSYSRSAPSYSTRQYSGSGLSRSSGASAVRRFSAPSQSGRSYSLGSSSRSGSSKGYSVSRSSGSSKGGSISSSRSSSSSGRSGSVRKR